MKKYTLISIGLAFTSLTITACAPFKPDSTHAGTCNELNSRMIFNGSSGNANIRQAEIEDAQQPLVRRNWDSKCE